MLFVLVLRQQAGTRRQACGVWRKSDAVQLETQHILRGNSSNNTHNQQHINMLGLKSRCVIW
jgi:hypothetical protein